MDELASFFGGRARLYRFSRHTDARGTLLATDQLPFAPFRAFLVRDVPPGTTRGGHAHTHGQQLLVRLSGRIQVELRAAGEKQFVELNESADALLIEAGVWARQTYLDAQLLVLASHPYDPASYLCDGF